TNTPYLKTLKNSRPLLDFEEYAVSTSADMPYVILWSTIKRNTFTANTPYPKTQYSASEYPILRIGQYSVFEDPILRIGQYPVSEDPILRIGQYSVSKDPILLLEKHKEEEELAIDHLSRFENPHMEVLTKREIANKFFDEHLMVLKSKFNNDEPCESRLMQLNKLAELRDGAYENTRIYKEWTKKWHDFRLRGDKDFKVGDKVLLYNYRLKMYPEKLKSKWSGPNIVKMVYPHGDMESLTGTGLASRSMDND
ncbi:hypothetical protein Tco_1325692, partial [Tanacetum coccineum]